MKTSPTFNYEEQFWSKGLRYIAGADEVGKGAFAGPVVAAAVILPANKHFVLIDKINDSKQLSAKQREKLDVVIKDNAICYNIATIDIEDINKSGIGVATDMALYEAVMGLPALAQHILVDAFYIKNIPQTLQTPIIKGDQKSYTIAAASIIAKVYRDKLMTELDKQYENYKFAKHKGYGTLAHRKLIKQYGLCPIHRTSFNLQKFL